MKLTNCLISLLLASSGGVLAYPAAPDYSLYGVVRNEAGRPLETSEGTVIVSGSNGEVTRSPIDTTRGRGINYTVHLPMDAGTTSELYQVTALRPMLPFTIKVDIRGVNYVPIQMAGRTWTTGKAGERQRLDLTLGVDSDGDGLADSWEWDLIENDPNGLLRSLADVRPGDDLDKDGLSNLQEFNLGTYSLDKLDGLRLEILEIKNGRARLQFAAVKGRTYYIKSASDLKTWKDEPIALTTTAEVQPYLRADSSGMVDVYIPVAERGKNLFQLYAE
jgi:hypothetical protein